MTGIAFAPLVDWTTLSVLGGLALIVLALGAFRRARGTAWRAAAMALLWLALAGPALIDEERAPIPDLAAVVVDDSPSQGIDGRRARTEATLARIIDRLDRFNGLEVRIVRAGGSAASAEDTRVFESIAHGLSDVPRRRMAATILLTDGQVHDVPKESGAPPFGGPLHVVLTGRRVERDRTLFIDSAPGFALVGKKATIRVRIEDRGAEGGLAELTIARDGRIRRRLAVPIGVARDVEVDIDHAGANIVALAVAGRSDELTMLNNRNVVEISGVRERLRVLLVSGQPHPGERVWRNFLKADPSVDLVHFTILRPPEKQDATPVHELSLIAFPIRELFEVKLDDFDLIIFDRYRRRGVLPGIYLENIVRFVENGGAVLEAAGPSYASALSLHRTPLGAILPGAPTGRVFERGLAPILSDVGRRHPVTADLPGAADGLSRWGRWFRQIEVEATRGLTLMRGAEAKPLLIVDRIGKGRIAQLMSDHIWLWARGFETGGPHSQILRRLSHWLMKEPDLEEDDLRAVADRRGLTILRRSIAPDHPPVRVRAPSGKTTTVVLEPAPGGRARARIPADEIGLYRISDGQRTALAAVGSINPVEFSDMRTSPRRLEGLVRATGGGIHWLEDGLPSLRRVRAGRKAAGGGWFGLLDNRGYRVLSVLEIPFPPAVAVLILGLGALMLAWRREGR